MPQARWIRGVWERGDAWDYCVYIIMFVKSGGDVVRMSRKIRIFAS